jgi:hypothetical protein
MVRERVGEHVQRRHPVLEQVAVVGHRRRHLEIHQRHDCGDETVQIGDGGDDLTRCLGQQPDQALPQQHRVVGYHHPHSLTLPCPRPSSAELSFGHYQSAR